MTAAVAVVWRCLGSNSRKNQISTFNMMGRRDDRMPTFVPRPTSSAQDPALNFSCRAQRLAPPPLAASLASAAGPSRPPRDSLAAQCRGSACPHPRAHPRARQLDGRARAQACTRVQACVQETKHRRGRAQVIVPTVGTSADCCSTKSVLEYLIFFHCEFAALFYAEPPQLQVDSMQLSTPPNSRTT